MRSCLQLLLLTFVLAACGDATVTGNTNTGGGGGGGAGASNTVSLGTRTFSPSSLTVQRGASVRWTNSTSISHTITPDNPGQAGVWSSVIMNNLGQEFSHTFNTAGTFKYHCSLHAGMEGTIVVQ